MIALASPTPDSTMTTDWTHFINGQALSADAADFGAPADELIAARDTAVIAPLLDIGVIRASGPDAASFLHNLLTNDVIGINSETARFAGFCTPKGRLLATMLIWREADDLLLALPADTHTAILKKLSMYVLRSKVKLSDASAEKILIGFKSHATAVAPAPTLAGIPTLSENTPVRTVIDIPDGKAIRLDSNRWLLAVNPESAEKTWTELAASARPVGLATWRWLEIVAGQPRVVAATQEAFVPQMLNMEHAAVAGVSFTKGCYPGQEIVARTQYLGKVKRRMYRAHLPEPFLPETHTPGSHVFATETGDQHCGSLVTVAPAPDGGYEALVCVQSGAVDAGAVHLGTLDGPRLSFLDLPYTLGT